LGPAIRALFRVDGELSWSRLPGRTEASDEHLERLLAARLGPLPVPLAAFRPSFLRPRILAMDEAGNVWLADR
jgi:hypothetical protein